MEAGKFIVKVKFHFYSSLHRRNSSPKSGLKKETIPVSAQCPFMSTFPAADKIIEVVVNDRTGKKVRVKCSPQDTIGDFKRLVAAQIGTNHLKISLRKAYTEYRDHITLDDCKFLF